MAHLQAGWALWGKRPGSNDDYSVLACSREPLAQPEFTSVLAHFAPGTPPTGDNLPGSLPWVIISRVGIEDRLYLGMAIQQPSGQTDGSGRPFSLTSYFCVPYAELRDAQVSFTGLYQALTEIQLPRAADDLIPLDIRPLNPAELAEDIERLEPSVTAAAALLLSGQTSVIGSDGSTVAERLRFLDAAAALLPYGYRSDLTAATWSDTAARPQLRLTFGGKAREGAYPTGWQTARAGGPPDDIPGGGFLRLLREVRARGKARRDDDQLAKLVGFMADDSAPALLTDPGRAVSSLYDFDLANIVSEAMRAGRARPEDVRALFDRSRINELREPEREPALATLIEFGDPRDIPLVSTWWDRVAGQRPTVALTMLAKTCRKWLWSPSPDHFAIKGYLELAHGRGLLDGLMADLVADPPGQAGSLQLSAAAELLYNWVLSQPHASFPRTQQVMASSQRVACELLSRLAGSPADLTAALTWLEPSLGQLLQPFSAVLADPPRPVEQSTFRQLARAGTDFIRILVQAASQVQRLNLVLPGFTVWLALSSLEQSTSPGSGQWYEVVWALTPSDATTRAWIDVVLLLMADQPRFLMTEMAPGSRKEYNAKLGQAWLSLAENAGQPVDNLLSCNLQDYLGRAQWTSDAIQVDTVVDIVQFLTADGRRPQLAAAVADALLAAPQAASRPAAQAWLAQVRPPTPPPSDGGKPDVLSLLHDADEKTTPFKLASICAQGYREKIESQLICQVLKENSRVLKTGCDAVDFLSWLRPWVYFIVTDNEQTPAAADSEHALSWLQWFSIRFADGSFGPELTKDFRQTVPESTWYEISCSLDLLYIAATHGQRGVPPELSDTAIARLEDICRSAERILKEARKRPSRGLFRRSGGEEAGGPQSATNVGTAGEIEASAEAAPH